MTLGDHPHRDPGDGRSECKRCGKWVWLVTHSCKRVPVTAPARARLRRPGAPVLRDAATICPDVLAVPGHPLRCELDLGHLDQGEKHKSGCTRWGRPGLYERTDTP